MNESRRRRADLPAGLSKGERTRLILMAVFFVLVVAAFLALRF